MNAFIKSSTLTLVLITVLTIGAELSAPLKDFLKESFVHHWIGKGVLALAFFIIVGLLLSWMQKSKGKSAANLNQLSFSSIFLSLVLLGFFMFETLVH